MKFGISCLVTILISVAEFSHGYSQNEVWGYNCSENKCIKVQINEENRLSVKSLASCRMFCSAPLATVWPKPTGSIKFEETLLPINPSGIIFNVPENKLWNAVQKRFNSIISNNIPEENYGKTGYTLKINISCEDGFSDGTPKLKLNTDEGYKLKINANEEYIEALIFSKNFFGARHGLETLSQLIIYDNLQNKLVMVANAEINDRPSFEWRGVTLDTSRNFFSIDTIKTTLDGMAMSKLNTFHWHITDSHSFPFEVKSQPELHRLGAYDSKKVYTHEQIMDLVEYGLARGIRVLPEFDAPAHVGEGWQNLNMTTCFNAQPWEKYCVEPPCGQLDPTVPELYDVLEKIYNEMDAVFKPDIFHMGGDEVSFKCWNSSARIQKFLQTKGWGLEEDGFFRLWNYFQQEALRRYDKVRDSNVTPIILWTSRLTESPQMEKYLDPNRYIIQIWSGINDANIKNILGRGYRTIFSNYDVLYLDCGGPGWVTGGQNWCSPYHGWQKIYSNSFETFRVGNENLVLGAEAAIWSEQIDDYTVMTRLFPRLSALAENLWTNSNQGWRKAESRFLLHRDWLVQNHIPAEALQPQWCLQNENECPIDSYRTD